MNVNMLVDNARQSPLSGKALVEARNESFLETFFQVGSQMVPKDPGSTDYQLLSLKYQCLQDQF